MKHLMMAAAAITLMSSPALADSYRDNSTTYSPLTGAYVGVMGGYTWGESDSSIAGVNPEVSGDEYGVFAGYKVDSLLDSTVNRMGLGLNGAVEAHYMFSTADDTDGGATFDKNGEFGLSFRPGVSFIDEMSPMGLNPYAIIGWKRTNFEASGGGVAIDKTYDGFELGIGTEVLAYEDYGIRIDYSHTWYEENGGFEPDEDSLRVGVAYHF